MNPQQPPYQPYPPQSGWQPMQGAQPSGGYPYPQQSGGYRQPTGQQPWPPMPPAPAPKKHRKWPWVVGVVVLLLIVIGSTSKHSGSSTSTPALQPGGVPQAAPAAAAPAASGHTVTYKVTGSGSGLVTYMKEGFQQEQVNGARLPWSKDLTFKDDITAFSGLSLVAQHSSGGGDITCKILVDGQEVASSTSSGAYAVVTCNGSQA